jgi:DNA polymerase alpha subunit B
MDAIPETEEIPFGSLCLDTIETAGNRKIPKNAADRRVHLVSNPSTIKINEVTIGLTSTDALMHLSTEEINQNLPPGTRICRLAEHFIHQQSYYPIFPPPSVGGTRVNLDVNMRSGYSLPVQPDILLLPSKLTCLAKDVAGGTIAINPGHLVKGAVGGTFAVIDIHPIDKEKLGDDEEEVISDVKDRTRVEIRKI